MPELVQVAEVIRQHTPKPAAQPPEAEPPLENGLLGVLTMRGEYKEYLESITLDVHSVEVTQVPVRLEVVVHASLGNWTTENRPMGMGLGAEELRPMATTSIMIEMKGLSLNTGRCILGNAISTLSTEIESWDSAEKELRYS